MELTTYKPGQITAPNMEALNNFMVNRIGQYEVITQALYDTVTLPGASASSTISFFTSINGKGEDETNMETAGQLPNPKFFLIKSIELVVLPGVTVSAGGLANDIQGFYGSGRLELKIGSKNYLQEAPLGVFPPKTHLRVDLAAQSTSEYAQLAGRPYNLTVPLLLEPMQNFSVKLLWDTPFQPVSTQDMRVICRLDGLEYRESQ